NAASGKFRAGCELQAVLILEREAQQRVRALQSQFPADVGAMVLNRAVVDGKLLSDFLARFVGSDQLHDAAFGWSEPAHQDVVWRAGWRGGLEQARRERRTEVGLTGGDWPDARNNAQHGSVLQDVA